MYDQFSQCRPFPDAFSPERLLPKRLNAKKEKEYGTDYSGSVCGDRPDFARRERVRIDGHRSEQHAQRTARRRIRIADGGVHSEFAIVLSRAIGGSRIAPR